MSAPGALGRGAQPPPAQVARPRAPGERVFWWVALALTITFMGPNIPTPLYVRYQQEWGFSAGMLTLVFAVYAVALLGALLFFGSASDEAGRRAVMAAAIILGAISSIVFILAGDVAMLFVARALSGLSAGIVTGSAAAALSELAPPGLSSRVPVVTTLATMGGLALAPLLSGVLSQYAFHPTKLVYIVYIGLLVVAALGVYLAPETVASRRRPTVRFAGLGVPTALRADLISAGIAAFCSFTLLGLFAALAPSFLIGTLHQTSAAVAGVVVFLIFATACLAEVLFRGLPHRVAVVTGFVVLVAGLWVIVAGLADASLAVFIVGTIIGGFGVGLVYGASLASANQLAPPEHRSQVISTYFVAANLGLIIPVISVGVASQHIGNLRATLICAVVITALVVFALINIARSHRGNLAVGKQ
jgi:MFS family permease